MTPQEFEYLKRAMAMLESGECNLRTEAKILQTMAEICGKNATKIKKGFDHRLVDNLDD